MITASSVGSDFVKDWVLRVGGVVPPFCVELFLKSGIRYYLHSVISKGEDHVVIRIWDFRAFSDYDFDVLRSNLNKVQNRSELSDAQKVHPKLDWANLRICADEIDYCVEWHDRLWPEEERPQIGYDTSNISEG